MESTSEVGHPLMTPCQTLVGSTSKVCEIATSYDKIFGTKFWTTFLSDGRNVV